MYCKRVTKPNHKNIQDWVAMMKYFQIDRHDLCLRLFEDGHSLYKAQLRYYKYYKIRKYAYLFSDFNYSENFVSINMKDLKRKFISTVCLQHYYGAEILFGKLCKRDKAFCVYNTD